MATVLMLHRVVKMDDKFYVLRQLGHSWSFVTKLETEEVPPERYEELADWPTALEARRWCANHISEYKHYKPMHLEIVGDVFGVVE